MTDELISRIAIGQEGDPVYDPTQIVTAELGIFGSANAKLLDRVTYQPPLHFVDLFVDLHESLMKAIISLDGLIDVARVLKEFLIKIDKEKLNRKLRYERRYKNRGRQIARRKAGKKP